MTVVSRESLAESDNDSFLEMKDLWSSIILTFSCHCGFKTSFSRLRIGRRGEHGLSGSKPTVPPGSSCFLEQRKSKTAVKTSRDVSFFSLYTT